MYFQYPASNPAPRVESRLAKFTTRAHTAHAKKILQYFLMITYVREAGIGLELVIPLKTAPLERKEKKEKTATVEERNEANT